MKNRIKSLLDKCILTTTRRRHGVTNPLQTTSLPLQMLQHAAAAPISSSTGPSLEKMKAKSNNMEWRKKQLDLLEQKFHPHKATTATTTNLMTHEVDDDDDDDDHYLDGQHSSAETMRIVQHDDDLQPMWKQMESRVKNRPTRSMEENQGRSGRENVKQTDEDEWLHAGLYNNGDVGSGDDISGGGAAAKSDR